MGKINIPLGSHDKNVEQENSRIFHLQNERYNLIEAIFYEDSIDELLQKWQNIVRKMAHNAVPKKIGVQWLASWNSHLEISLNNFQCSGIVYEQDVRSQTTNIIPGQEFLQFMYKMESLILQLFEKHKEFGPNILQYIHNSLLCNIPLLESFNILLNTSTCQKLELKDDVKNFLYERIVSTYMKSRQKSWRRFNDLIPEKGTSSLRENLKSMRNDNQIKTKYTLKKTSIPKDPVLGLKQLQVWARLNGAEEEFTKIFLVSELQWLLWAFGNNVKTDKKKKNLIPLVLDHLKKETPFSKEAILKGQIFK
ncbi:hypothetical protein RhiirC2_857935 [Rhizophagus irregularis]|uniref:Uncharacterized protein n=1 Tax=Rhizophagus irregularis TaxID=588596 RepID=A0A2N1M915_9GLOM|nr:hypothetical protein RhiirC2_857935 [Rhizophagus irregularis]